MNGPLSAKEWRKRYASYLSEPTVYMKPYCDPGRRLIDLLGRSAGPHDGSVYYDLVSRSDILPGMAGRLVISWTTPSTGSGPPSTIRSSSCGRAAS